MLALLVMLPLLAGAFLFSDTNSDEEPETEIESTDGDDTLHGTNRGETLYGNGGDDLLWGWGGDDTE